MIITQREFEDLIILKPEWKEWMVNSIHSGLADYNNPMHYSAVARKTHNATARAVNRNCQIVAHARQALFDLPDIRECPQENRMFFILGDQVRISFKMLDFRLRPKNYPTIQTAEFMGQRLRTPKETLQAYIPDLALPEVLPNLVVGYKYSEDDITETKYDIYVVCPNGNINDWTWQISSSASLTELLPFIPSETAPSTAEYTKGKKRVRIRKLEKEQETNDQSRQSS